MANYEVSCSVSTASGFKVTSGAARADYSFEWKVNNFMVIKSSKDFIDEQQFQFAAGESLGTTTKWRCYLRENAESKNIGILMKLANAPPKLKSAILSYKFSVMRANGEVIRSRKVESRQFTVDSNGWGFPDFIPSDEEALKDMLWEDGSIVIKVDVSLFLIMPNRVDIQEELNNLKKRELQKLSDFMGMTFQSETQPDVGKILKVVSKDDKQFYANTAILSGRSPVFQAMFNSENWKEGQGSSGEATLVLEDLSGKTVKVLLHYLMCGVLLQEDWKAEDVILELTWAAQKYQLEDLTQFLDKVLPALDYNDTEVVAKLALLSRRLGLKNSEETLFLKLKGTARNIDELVLDRAGSFLEKD